MYLNHPETVPPTPQSMEKIIFHETGPWCHEGWGLVLQVK